METVYGKVIEKFEKFEYGKKSALFSDLIFQLLKY